jgi:uncharacterized protein YjbI with pentapeptide repeats
MATDKKKIAERYLGEVKAFYKFFIKSIKDNVEDNGEELLNNAGATGSLIKLFGQSKIDSYFENLKDKKLLKFGVFSYLKAAIDCANTAVGKIPFDEDYIYAQPPRFNDFIDTLTIRVDSIDDLRLYLNPRHNPAIQEVKAAYISYYNYLNVSQKHIDSFSKYFETSISTFIKESFGSSYDEHQKEVRDSWYSNNEEKLLSEMTNLRRIGLQEGEKLGYEDTYGRWQDFESLKKQSNQKEKETNQVNVIDLLEEHFTSELDDYWKNAMTFIVADFGKGKSVFMKQYAATLSDKYQDTKSEYIPVYFNLNQFHDKEYDPSTNRGILYSFLKSHYAIELDSDYFKDKSFVFLVDSLDESGDLSQIHDVLTSVYNINKNAPIDSPIHKIIVASRPIDKELSKAICEYKSKLDENKHAQFISLFGFKASQFDHWLKESVLAKLSTADMELKNSDSITQLLFDGWKKDEFSAHKELLSRNVLSEDELVKPLFAYILYQLLANDINIPSNGRVGIYLAFLHYISSQAKFIQDGNVSIKNEHCNRKVLHAIAALWSKQRSIGTNYVISKNDINFTLLGTNTPDSQETQQLDKIKELKFLSHSYFGDKEQHLHFQHQSFAEILHAEYLLKVFLCEALDDEPNINITRQYLFVGEPTIATMEFFSELIKLLAGSVLPKGQNLTALIISKRRLLLPLIGSLASPIFRKKLHSKTLKAKLYETKEDLYSENDILKKHWPISVETLESLTNLCSDIITQNNKIILAPSRNMTALFDNEILMIEKKDNCDREDIDKWLAIALGGILSMESVPRKYYFENSVLANCFLELIDSSSQKYAPDWISTTTKGVFHKMNACDINISGVDIESFDFTQSVFVNVHLRFCCIMSDFKKCTFEGVIIEDCFLGGSLKGSSLENISLNGTTLSNCDLSELTKLENVQLLATSFFGVELPMFLQTKLSEKCEFTFSTSCKVVFGETYTVIENEVKLINRRLDPRIKSLISLLESALTLEVINSSDITNSFEFMSNLSLQNFLKHVPKHMKNMFTMIRDEPEYLILEKEHIEQQEKIKKEE